MNNPKCIYCQGEQIAGCYCVQRFTFVIPAPYDAHVNAYDQWVINRAVIKAKQSGDYVQIYKIKSALNCYMKPIKEIRRMLQYDN